VRAVVGPLRPSDFAPAFGRVARRLWDFHTGEAVCLTRRFARCANVPLHGMELHEWGTHGRSSFPNVWVTRPRHFLRLKLDAYRGGGSRFRAMG
jgi:hypothetical protein